MGFYRPCARQRQQDPIEALGKTGSFMLVRTWPRAEENVELPVGLQNLCFGFDFDQSLENVSPGTNDPTLISCCFFFVSDDLKFGTVAGKPAAKRA